MKYNNDRLDITDGRFKGLTASTEVTFISSDMIGAGLTYSGNQLQSTGSVFLDVFGGMQANSATGSYEDLRTITLPIGLISDQEGVYLRAGVLTDSNADPKQVKLSIDGQTIYEISGTLNDRKGVIDFDIIRDGANVSVCGIATGLHISDESGVGVLFAIDWASPVDITISASCSNIGDVELFTAKVQKINI